MSAADPSLSSRSRFQGHMALVVVQFCFALFPVFGKFAFEHGAFTPFQIGAWRMLFGAVSLFAIAFAVHGRAVIPRRRDLGILFVGSLLGVTFNMLLYLEGLKRSTPTNASLMMGLIPVFTFAIAAFAGQERFRWVRCVGVVIALFGASMRFWAESPDLVREHALGNALMAANTLCYAGYFVWTRQLARRIPPLVTIAWVFLFAVPVVPFLVRDTGMMPHDPSSRTWWALAFILVFPTSVAYLLNMFALSRLSASTTAIYIYVQPVITGIASYFLLGEEVTRGMVLSAAFVFAGIYLVAGRPAPPVKESPHGSPEAP